ncbi:MAG: PAS domain S-box protein [Rhodothermales bacterium]|nr:PAS domain S-box protein [Rhodothermales bacterium]
MTRPSLAAAPSPTRAAARRYLDRIAHAREYVLLAALFVGAVVGIAGVTFIGLEVLSAARASTNAEALYSKAQKDAVYYLHQYATSSKDEYFEKYRQAIAVPLGYRQARVELEKTHPEAARIREGLLQGRSYTGESGAAVSAYRLLRSTAHGRRAFRLWSEADLLVAQLQIVAELLREEVASGTPAPARVGELLREVERLNVNLTTLEDAFSMTMGAAARQVRWFVLGGVLGASLLLLFLGLVPSWRILKRLKDSREQFRRLFEQSRDAIVYLGLDGQVAYANPAAYALFGYPEALALPAHLPLAQHFAHPEDRRRMLRHVRADGFVQDVEVPLRRRDGGRIDALVTATLIRDRDGRTLGIEALVRDESARKRTERRMRLLERAVEASGNVILVTDATQPDFPLVYVNPAFERLTGYTPEEALGRDGFFLLTSEGEAADVQLDLLRKALDAGAESRVVLRTHRKDGAPLWNELCFTPVYDDDGRLINYVGIQTDVTEAKEAEAALTQALERERELSELQARFVSMASHELRTPLAAILSSAELIERFRHRWDEGRTLKHLRRIQANVHALTTLLENVLVIGRADAGRLRFAPGPVALDALVREIVEEVNLGLAEPRAMALDVGPGDFEGLADPHLLRHILTNLLTNALKYSEPKHPIEVGLRRDEDRAVFRVADRGIGIPEADLPRIFEPFHRGANAETRPGTGLGLSIVARAVELHGGAISVESEEEGGTVVEVSIPLYEPQSAGHAMRNGEDSVPTTL